jgi:hypothetical protein
VVTGASPRKGSVAARLVGAWRYVGIMVDGAPRPGDAKTKGIIYYGASGEMAVQVAPDKLRKCAGAEPTPEEAKEALIGYVAYFGTYSIDAAAGTVTHHREISLQPGSTYDVVRKYKFVDDRLILRPVGENWDIVWERIK